MVSVETIRILRRSAQRDEVVLRRGLRCEVAAVKVTRRRWRRTEGSGGDRDDQRRAPMAWASEGIAVEAIQRMAAASPSVTLSLETTTTPP